MATNDFPIVATAGRIVNWLNAHDEAVSSDGRRRCLKYLALELRNLQRQFSQEPDLRADWSVSDSPIDRHTKAALERVREICSR